MDTLTDYILWRGDLGFDQIPFCLQDAIVLSQVTYFDMKPYFKRHRSGSISAVYRYLAEHEYLNCTLVGPEERSKKLFEAAAMSARYGAIRICRHVDKIDPDNTLQFAAMTFAADRFRYVSFRGTDASVAGWKEDCMMTFRKTIAQELAAVYLEKSLKDPDIEPGLSVLVGGHSKGANLAMYAAAMQPETLHARIERVYALDGPGFCSDVLDTDRLKKVEDKIIRVIPEDCIIGKIFETKAQMTVIVKSTDVGILQHDMSGWRVDHCSMLEATETSPISNLLSGAFMRWLNDMNLEERAEFVEKFFTVLTAHGESRNWGLNLTAVNSVEGFLQTHGLFARKKED